MFQHIVELLGIDQTLFIHLGLITFFFMLFSPLALRPWVPSLIRRRKATTGAADQLGILQREIQELDASLKNKEKELQRQIQTLFQAEEDQSRKVGAELLSQTQLRSKENLIQKMGELEQERKRVLEEARGLSKELAQVIFRKVTTS